MLRSSLNLSAISCAAAVSLFLSAPAGSADVTSAEVWADWRGYMEGFGYSVNGDETTSGDTLSVSDIVMSFPVPGAQDSVEYRIPKLDFVTRRDGTVDVTMDPNSDIVMDMTSEAGEDVNVQMSYDTSNFVMTVSGTAEALKYVYSADALTVSLDELTVDGARLPADAARFAMAIANVSGTTDIAAGETRAYDQTMTSGAVTYDVAFIDPEGKGRFQLKGGNQGINFSGTGDIPTTADAQDVNALLAAGFNFSGTLGFLAGNMDLGFDGPDGAGTVSSTSTGGGVAIAMGPDGINYDVSQTGIEVSMLMPDLPLPVSFSMQDSKFNLAIPVQKSDEEQDFAFGFRLGGFTMSDMIWGIFDPVAQLPRDPATIAISLTGKAKVLVNFLDPMQAAALESSGALPGELNALTLQNIVIDAVGARLTGAGDFSFDNSDLVSFDGMPRPTGAVDLKLVGGNGLIDKLVAMQLLPEQQAMGARMMMGLFAVPGEGEDTLNSKIEINGEGHILANGQRIQ